jgi:uncharacterized protein YkwD
MRWASIAIGLLCALVISAPHARPLRLNDAERVSERVLQLVNKARSHSRRCGTETLPAVNPVKLSAALAQTARAHARDMATHNFFEHTGSDGSTPTARLARIGYRWLLTGENIAYGPTSAEEVISGWLASPGHCENIMETRFTEMGIGYAFGSTRSKPMYWAQDFAVPRKP